MADLDAHLGALKRGDINKGEFCLRVKKSLAVGETTHLTMDMLRAAVPWSQAVLNPPRSVPNRQKLEKVFLLSMPGGGNEKKGELKTYDSNKSGTVT